MFIILDAQEFSFNCLLTVVMFIILGLILDAQEFSFSCLLTKNYTHHYVYMQAIKALKLCCKAIWNHLVYLCEMHVEKSHIAHEDDSEKSIMDLVKEASEKTAFLLELNNQEGGCNINSVIVESLVCWSTAEKLICGIPTPVSFIKKFVKVLFYF